MSLFWFCFGAIVGSFLNVVGLRFRSGVGLGGRSFCPTCHKQLQWWELVPILSFALLRGRCSRCRAKISWQYPLIEVFTALTFLGLFELNLPPVIFGLFLVLFSIYIVILIYDFRHKIIPDPLNYTAVVIALASRFLMGGTLLDWFAGPILFAFFALIWLVTRGRAMGFGDAKLVLSLGLALGFEVGLSGVVFAFWIGAAVGVGLLAFQKSGKKLTIKSEIPFAPFLVLGAWLSLLFHLNLIHALTIQ
jgi:prepilin signal peptidase PulO-like enzyme (type II secretory pathway)